MNIFENRDRILTIYKNFVEGFLHNREPGAKKFLEEKVTQRGAFYPDSLNSVNPSNEIGGFVTELVKVVLLHPGTVSIFQKNGKPFRPYKHQKDAIHNYRENRSTIVMSDTGSDVALLIRKLKERLKKDLRFVIHPPPCPIRAVRRIKSGR